MNTLAGNRLVVLDPGLGPEGGHHVALLERVYDAMATGEYAGLVDFYCSRQLSGNLKRRYASELVRITPFFDADFYRYYAKIPCIAEVNGYIAALGLEYLSVFKRVFAEYSATDEVTNSTTTWRREDEKLLVFYPAMQWMHLMALHFALRRIGDMASGLRVEHRLCLMYNPGRDFEGRVASTSEWLSYKLACKSLAAFDDVKLYASDYELADHYMHLLELDAPLPMHPQYLAQRGTQKGRQQADKQGKTIGLYLGDAKIEKGFALLPDLVERLLPTIGKNDQIVIQYVSQGNCPKVRSAEEQIRTICERESRLKLSSTYLPAKELQTILSSLDVFVFTYDAMHYRNKSSGFLWLLADKGCALIFLGESWLSREARRLRMVAYVCAVHELQDVVRNMLSGIGRTASSRLEEPESSGGPAEIDYWEQLSYPLFAWLFSGSQS